MCERGTEPRGYAKGVSCDIFEMILISFSLSFFLCPFPEKAGYQSPYGGMDNGVVSFVLFLALFYLFSPSLDVEMKLFISEWGPPFFWRLLVSCYKFATAVILCRLMAGAAQSVQSTL